MISFISAIFISVYHLLSGVVLDLDRAPLSDCKVTTRQIGETVLVSIHCRNQ